ncbi:DUF4870 domain-containing protein [Leucobacter manosquensis]|uniref:DUF4870 domain-containing protein n=1 Tax=Leucobacter manosquensis TaxID=2810611 RepID=A0ABS5M731_9MICO|nr:DUF4870 domain-containing protein [Leucobacter manosquensis]MBS3182989.1 DUF4870 domain-containing protein [Leucobacter manosquensis]
MTTLPPEDQPGRESAAPVSGDPAPTTPPAPPAPPATPQSPPSAPETPSTAPQFQSPQYQAPATPPVPPQAPQYQAPQYQAPNAQQPQQPQQPPQYGAPGQTPPPPGGYQQPPAGYAQPVADPASNVVLNYWLSVFFSWIPALIFFLVDKDKGDQRLYAYQRDNLNFSLLRVGVGLATWILGLIPYLGLIFGFLLGIGSVVLFVFHIIAAVKASEGFRRGEQPGFIFNVPLIK